jgi:hypothetical protein
MPGFSGVYYWTDGNEVFLLQKWKDLAEIITIVRVPCRLGGRTAVSAGGA